MPTPEASTHPMEQWFSEVARKQACTPAHLALAMQEDGMQEQEAWVFAAAAFIRYSPVAITDLFTSAPLRDALIALRRHSGAAQRAFSRQQCPAPQPTPALLDPSTLRTNHVQLDPQRQVSVQFVSHSPQCALFGNFLSQTECEELIALAKATMQRSMVIDVESGASGVNMAHRSSDSTFIEHGSSQLVSRMQERAALLVGCPVTHFEHTAVTRYGAGHKFGEHVDYLHHADSPHPPVFGDEGDRVATLIVYLNEVQEGGATVFPVAGLEVRPQRGSALYFSYLEAGQSMDAASLHAGAAIDKGEKWIATIWMHARPFSAPEVAPRDQVR